MKFFLLTGLLLLGVCPLYAQTPKPPQQLSVVADVASAGFSPVRLKRLDDWISAGIASGKMPNLVMVVARNGQLVYHKAFGYRNLEQRIPASTADIFRIASQTKAIATVALMTLYEEGRFGLDDPISRYIPAFADARVLVRYDTLHPASGTYETRPVKNPITIRQLLSHTAGIPYEHPLEQRPEFRLPYLASLDADTLATVIDGLARRPLVAEPGTAFVYGLNTDVIGRLVEVLSGQRLDVAIRQRVTEPLGMNDTHFYLPQEKTQRLVELYSKPSASAPLALSSSNLLRNYPVSGARTYLSAGAGMLSTALDYARFCQMLLNGGSFNNRRILAPSTIALMLRNQIGDAEVWDRRDKFGLGFQLITPQTHYGDAATPGSYTWGGAYCSEYTIDPKEGLVIQFFTNVYPYAHYSELTRTLRVLVYQAME